MSGAAEPITPMGVAATYFDGRNAAGTAVQLVPAGQRIEVRAGAEGAVIAEIELDRDQLFERFGFAPRQIVLASGASVEVPITVAAEAVLASAGAQPAPVARWQQRWPLVLAMLAGLLVAGVLGYLHALPRVVHWLAFQVPQPYVERLDLQVMAALERERLQPSRLSAERQAQIAERFAAAAARHAPDVRYSMVFRSMSGAAGINAFALPGGTIVVLDGLVELLGDNAVGNDRLLAVLGHELGHVAGRHSLRRLMQTTAVALGATVLWGDAAGLAANIPVLLSGLSFSRDMEREADDFSVGFLHSNGFSEAPLVGLFKEFERLNRGKEPPGFLSTHPSPKERQRRIEARSAE
jgi:Zn-dependent protease with chaperone function